MGAASVSGRGGAGSTRGHSFDGEVFEVLLGRGGAAVRRGGALAVAAGRGAPWAVVAAVVAAPRVAAAAAVALGALALLQHRRKSFSARVAAVAVPVVMGWVDEALRDLRLDQLKGLRGRVLDVGCGDAPYLEYARGKPVELYVCLEPNPGLQGAVKARAEKLLPVDGIRVEQFAGTLEELPAGNYPEGSFDAVILGNVLCEVPDPKAAVARCRALLRPGGRVYFCEHVLDQDVPLRRALQRAINPWWSVVSDGCNCNRDSVATLRGAFGAPNVASLPVYLDHIPFPWLARFELGVAVHRGP